MLAPPFDRPESLIFAILLVAVGCCVLVAVDDAAVSLSLWSRAAAFLLRFTFSVPASFLVIWGTTLLLQILFRWTK